MVKAAQIRSMVMPVPISLRGGEGDDVLEGGADDDTLYGDAGAISSVVVAVRTRSTVVPMTTHFTVMWGLIPSLVAPAMTV